MLKKASAFPVVRARTKNMIKRFHVVFVAACLASAIGMLAIAADQSPQRNEPRHEAKAASRKQNGLARRDCGRVYFTRRSTARCR